jgi:hypothetical protein
MNIQITWATIGVLFAASLVGAYLRGFLGALLRDVVAWRRNRIRG